MNNTQIRSYWNFRSETWPINKENFPIHFFSIIGLFLEDSEYQLDTLYYKNGVLYLKCNDGTLEYSELMLRVGQDINQLVVARVCFRNKRKGYMTKLHHILCNFKETHHIDCIVIENAWGKEMQNWCEKFDYIKTEPYDLFGKLLATSNYTFRE